MYLSAAAWQTLGCGPATKNISRYWLSFDPVELNQVPVNESHCLSPIFRMTGARCVDRVP
jgi:hypothetical protein